MPVARALTLAARPRGPSNLHLAFAGREVPDGLDVASPLLSGHAEALGTEHLRFSRPEVGRFFGPRLSRRGLAKEVDPSAGWPVALRVARNGMERTGDDGSERADGFAGCVDLASRSWREMEAVSEAVRRARKRELIPDGA